ncbi:glycoside hydrolase family 13 protein [Lactiplantibacillus modestisalitolerans]|uniref:Alpha-glucosidase n=1 Tax=Lactiplantibacillus modestisalitolerans TaxID=1457219 RepID=A0ABV5WSB9_9LACO|nr:alpha-glucosidase [Lactiplantibacillus modestisalitolerans]
MGQPWWQSAVVYQIYPRSFQDSDGDGIGDLQGIISRLDYLQELGVGAIWLSPVYRSPNADNGYDVADYEAINPEYGTMADMDALITAAKAHGIRVVMDLILNHTSDEHPWFVNAKADPAGATRDYYVWSDPVDGQAPNDLQSDFSGGSAWELDAASQQYFLHLFSAKQVDLNWQSPRLRHAVYRMINFWLAKGVAGFRLDVVDMLGKRPFQKQLVNGPHLHDYLHEMNRATWGDRDVLTVGEAWSASPVDALQYSDAAHQELSMIFQFGHLWADRQLGGPKWAVRPLNVGRLKAALYACQTTLATRGWNSLFWSNHDLPRAVSRFGAAGTWRVRSAQMLAITLHGLKGTPYVYQGEEIGMTDCPVSTIAAVNDVEARTIYRQLLAEGDAPTAALTKLNRFSRDNARTPMQWDGRANAGFTSGQPWLAVNANYPAINVATDRQASTSIFATYQRLIALRRANPVLQRGTFNELTAVPEPVFAYTRSWGRVCWLICTNFGAEPVTVTLPEQPTRLILSNYPDYPDGLGTVELRPYEAMIVALI